MRFFKFFMLFALVSFVPIYTAQMQIHDVTGTWTNAVSGSGTPTNFSGGGTNEIHWGNATGSDNSGYNFTSLAPINNISLDTPFALGTFTHYNFPITGNALTSVTLNVATVLKIGGNSQTINSIFNFTHNETPNTGPGCCNDIVTFANNIAQSQTVNIGGVDYIIGLLGFRTSVNGPLLTEFSTIENLQNTATLFAQISTPEVFAPEPSTYLIMGSMLLFAALLVSRRKQKVKVES